MSYFSCENHEHCAPVEHVMYSGRTECTFEFILVANLCHCNQRVGHGGANVSAHNHRNGYVNVHARAYSSHDDRRECGRTLHQDCA